MRRYLIFPLQFDTRSHTLDEIGEHWEQSVKDLHIQNREKLIESLKSELGEYEFEQKLQNFKDLGSSPFSIVAHHNALFHQARYAFIHCFYYPALTAACALGERILNHLLLDLRQYFPQSTVDRKSHTRSSIDDWSKAIETLNEWKVFQSEEVKEKFGELKRLRNRSLHFNPSTISTLREDSLSALKCLAAIIDEQFGFQYKNAIPGTKGAFFLRKEVESNPFIRHYYLPQCAYVTPYYAMNLVGSTWLVFDRATGADADGSDKDYVKLYEDRAITELVPVDVPWADDISVVAMTPVGVKRVEYRPQTEVQS